MGRLKLHAIGSLDELREVDLSGYSRCLDDRAIERLVEGYKDATTKHQSFEKVHGSCKTIPVFMSFEFCKRLTSSKFSGGPLRMPIHNRSWDQNAHGSSL